MVLIPMKKNTILFVGLIEENTQTIKNCHFQKFFLLTCKCVYKPSTLHRIGTDVVIFRILISVVPALETEN